MTISLNEMTIKAQALKAKGRLAEAARAHRAIVEIAPDNVAVLHNLAAALGEIGRYNESVEILKRAFNLGLDTPETWLVYARSLTGMMLFDDAQEAYLNILRRKPLDHDAHKELVQLIWMRTGDVSLALQVLNRAVEAYPSAQNLHIARAQAYGQMGDPTTEHAIVKEALQLSGGAPSLELAACNSALADERFDEALGHARRAILAMPEDLSVLTAHCQALLATGDAGAALQIAEKLRAKAPLNQLFIALQATAWRLLGDERYNALFDYERLVRPSPLTTPKGWGSLGAYIDDLVAGLDKLHKFTTHPFAQSVRHGSQISFIDEAEDPALRAFPQAAAGPVRRYVDALTGSAGPLQERNKGSFMLFSVWSISLPPKGFHVNHVHPQGWLSSACHLRLPAPSATDDEHAGWLKFGEPGVATAPQLDIEHFVKPEPGVMAVFPSYMWHGTVPFKAEPARLAVAADFIPAAPDENGPD